MSVSIADVDGSTPGVAVLVVVNMVDENPNPQWSRFVEGERGCADPHLSATRLLNGIRDDFPGCEYTVVVNERARYLMAARRMHGLLGEMYGPAEYVADAAMSVVADAQPR